MSDDQPLPIDISLLDGLQEAMSEEEQKEITSLMTSGDPEKLALAARVLSGMAELLREGVLPSGRSAFQNDSVRALQETPYTNNVAVRRAMLRGHESTVKKIRLREAEIREKKRFHPLPSRMPRYAWIEPFDPEGSNKGGLLGAVGVPTIGVGPVGKGPLGRRVPPSLTFVDDEWDGELGDAFVDISIDHNGKVNKTHVRNPGIKNLLDMAGATRFVDGPTPRVLIHKVCNDAAKKALRPGDVITHVNGEAFFGTSQDLCALLEKIKEEGRDKVNLVVNADQCIAEALRLRAIH